MKKILLSTLLTFLAAFLFAAEVVPAQTLQADLAKSFTRVEAVKLNPAQIKQSKVLPLNLDGQSVRIALEENDLRSEALRRSEEPKVINTYKGTIAGEPGSTIRVNFRPTGVQAVILRGGESFYVQPASVFSKHATTDDAVVYKAGDAIGGAGRNLDGMESAISRAIKAVERTQAKSLYRNASYGRLLPASLLVDPPPFSPLKTLQLRVWSDREWLAFYGNNYYASRDEIDFQ